MPIPPAILRVHHAGDWPADDVRTIWVPSTYAAPPDVVRAIDDVWERAMIEPNRSLFDGPMCRLESWAVGGDHASAATPGVTPSSLVDCAFSRTTYKVFWGTNITHPEWADRYGPAVMANPVGVSPALETADGFLLFGRRNAKVAYYPSRVHPFAGAVEPDDEARPGMTPPPGGTAAVAVGGGPDLFAAVRRELHEEVRLVDADLDVVRLTGVVEDLRLRQPELIFRVKVRVSRARLEAQMNREEHHYAVAVRTTPAEVATALGDPAITPVGVASLLLWGRVAFGEAWYAEHVP
jgi:8-oxo-dGTP pyrophosphatase MutT (NUDIX family)